MDINNLTADNRYGLRIGAGNALFLFICWWLLAWIFGAVVITHIGAATLGRLRVAIMLQDIIIFILPTLMTLAIAARNPWKFCHISQSPGTANSLLTLATIVVAIPAMNLIIKWNEGLHLPESMVSIENFLRNAEDNANATITMLLGETGIGDMLISVLLIGILTGVAEELFFRGGLQNILKAMFHNRHLAVWVTAFVFSAIHMQFFGFFPRLIMGVFFGYLVLWNGTLWLSIIAHSFNNSIVVLTMWLTKTNRLSEDINNIGTEGSMQSIVAVIISAVLTAVIIYYMKKRTANSSK